MASETRIQPRRFPPAEVWPPDDTEESILGIHLHQTTITNLRWGTNEAGRIGVAPGQPAKWEATDQLLFLGCVRPNGTAYRTYPDLFVYPHPIDPRPGSFSLEGDGPPVLIIEVLSDSTYEADLDVARGKGYSYARAGVREYLAIDPTGAFLPEGIRAWRLDAGVYRPWEAEADGHWHSAQIGVAIGLEGMLASVYTREGRRMLHEGEIERALAERDEALAQRDEELARKDAELARLQRLLDERQGTSGK